MTLNIDKTFFGNISYKRHTTPGNQSARTPSATVLNGKRQTMKHAMILSSTTPTNEKWREAVHETLRKTLLYIWEQPASVPCRAQRPMPHRNTPAQPSALALTNQTGQ